MIKITNTTESLGLYKEETFESEEEMRSLVSDWLLEGGMEDREEREAYIERWMEEVSFVNLEEKFRFLKVTETKTTFGRVLQAGTIYRITKEKEAGWWVIGPIDLLDGKEVVVNEEEFFISAGFEIEIYETLEEAKEAEEISEVETYPHKGYVKIGGQIFLQILTAEGFEIVDDDQTWENGHGIADGKEIVPLEEDEVPEEEKERLGWILAEAE